ncbi:MAG: polysaccharide biosynthesis protein [Rhodobacter sp.]|nr:polysaccharide biosynthesis protein [Rhodobacter sp.]
MQMITLADFKDDAPWTPDPDDFAEVRIDNQIDGVEMRRLSAKADGRGDLTVLMSDRFGTQYRTPHVYLVRATARSVRAWVYHKRQWDRLAYTSGTLRIVLYDLRPESPTYKGLNVLDLGAANKVMLSIPPLVVHGVQNLGDEEAYFVNMPTRAYDPGYPDKSRLPIDHPGISYRFE